jgi:hypothetical protein
MYLEGIASPLYNRGPTQGDDNRDMNGHRKVLRLRSAFALRRQGSDFMIDTNAEAIREAELKELRSAHFRRLLIRALDEGLVVELLRDAGFHVPGSALGTLAIQWLRPLWLRSRRATARALRLLSFRLAA